MVLLVLGTRNICRTRSAYTPCGIGSIRGI